MATIDFDDSRGLLSLRATLRSGGYIILDDLWISSIQTAVAFVRVNRSDFVEIPAHLEDMCVFKKVDEGSCSWDHFRAFAVFTSAKNKKIISANPFIKYPFAADYLPLHSRIQARNPNRAVGVLPINIHLPHYLRGRRLRDLINRRIG